MSDQSSQSNQACLLIDDQPVPFTPGQTIMQAAEAAGIYIPHLCYHPALSVHGSCKLCTVEANGRRVTACSTPCSEGMRVDNSSEALRVQRQQVLQLLLVEGSHHCPSCECSGNCQLQASAYDQGVTEPGWSPRFPHRAVDASHPDIVLDPERCILCGLCVRASDELDGKNVFFIAGRGADSELRVNSATGKLGDSALTIEDAAAHICPVGALLVRGVGYRTPIGQRLYDVEPIRQRGNQRVEALQVEDAE